MDKKVTTPGNAFPRLFTEVRDGEAQQEASVGLAELVQAVRETGKAGTITVQLKVTPASRGRGMAVNITDKITVKKPAMPSTETIMFAGEDGSLTKDNPLQAKLQLQEVKRGDSAELKQAEQTPAPLKAVNQ